MEPNPSSVIHAPEPITYSVLPLSRLPVELTLHILQLCDPDIKARLGLTHVCRQWRFIAINSPSMWNFIRIFIDFPPHSKRSDTVIALLDIQLGRANGLPLDVEWIWDKTAGFDPRLLDLIRQKGPFSQWRTLKVSTKNVELGRDDALALGPCDVFSNLESLRLLPAFESSIVKTVARTATSKLQFLQLQSLRMTQMEMEANYKGMLQRISHLKVSSTDIMSLPANILELKAFIRIAHDFPHIKKYALSICDFGRDQPCDLKNLTHLTVTRGLTLNDDVEVYFPVLRHFKCTALVTGHRSKIYAPLLETLGVTAIEHPDDAFFKIMITRLNLGGYVLSPRKSITLDGYLPQHTAVIFLEQSSRAERVLLSFKDAASGEKMLERMEGEIRVDGSEDSTLSGRLCENMEELRINLGYEICDLEAWKRRASRLVESRRTRGFELRVYASWKGEGTYVPLA